MLDALVSASLATSLLPFVKKQRTEANEMIQENSRDGESEQSGAPSEIIHAHIQTMVILLKQTPRETGEVKIAHLGNLG